MNTKLTKDQVEAYRRDGVLIYRGLLSAREVERMISDIAEAIGKMGTDIVAGNREFGTVPTADSKDYYAKVFLQRVNMWKVSDAIKRTFLGPELGEMLCRLEGVDGMRVWHDQTLQKLPWANPTSWHLDNPNWSFHSRHAISIWIALDDATVQNGCMCYLPGTHLTSTWDKNGGVRPRLRRAVQGVPGVGHDQAGRGGDEAR